ncbi:MAG: 50S ribosome-binding GTPase, partial [Synergistaceae bacterium]|nr:50S ribosome-binding GTPase [Synergistaceae bacterium]
PGETEFERHRRKLERRIKHIERRLGDVRNRRGRNRYRRSREGVGIVSLAGYTNSGKSTLLRALSRDPGIVAEDRLFSTLDTVIRRVASPGGGSFLLSDTVGFIRNLPTELVAAFRSTLEEVTEADLLYVVLDAAAPEPMTSFEVVLKTLDDIGAGEIPRIVILNKMDRAGENAVFVQAELASRGEETARVSAISGEGLPELTERTCERLMSIKEKSTGTEPAASRGFVRS